MAVSAKIKFFPKTTPLGVKSCEKSIATNVFQLQGGQKIPYFCTFSKKICSKNFLSFFKKITSTGIIYAVNTMRVFPGLEIAFELRK
jgi:hypothetical protein